jgi:NAD(P)-dependent dehydrogenase (short-subunit alcohol dehydrogenase family)
MRELFRQEYATNVFGTAAVSDAMLPLLEKSHFPRIVNVSSTLGSIEFQLTPGTGYPVEFLMVCILHSLLLGYR